MSVKTGRAEGKANVTVDAGKCNSCRLCVMVCKGGPLYADGDLVGVNQDRFFGCIGCGQCLSVCESKSIRAEGRDLFPSDVEELPPPESRASYEALKALMTARRSTRDFEREEVEEELFEKILDVVATAPMGIPPSDVEVLVLKGRAKVRAFADDIIALMRKSRWLFSPFMQRLLPFFVGKAAGELLGSFVVPAMEAIIKKRKAGEDWLMYGAPLALLFHASPYADPADPVIAATYAMLAAESLGLGSCLVGFASPFLRFSPSLKRKYDIPPGNRLSLVLLLGHSKVPRRYAIKRRLARIHGL